MLFVRMLLLALLVTYRLELLADFEPMSKKSFWHISWLFRRVGQVSTRGDHNSPMLGLTIQGRIKNKIALLILLRTRHE